VHSRIKKISSGFQGRIVHYLYENTNNDVIYPKQFMEEAGEAFLPHLYPLLESYSSVKINFELFGEYGLLKEEKECIEIKSFQSKMTIISAYSNIENEYKEHMEKILARMEEFKERDSGWTLLHLIRLEMNINQYSPLRGSSYIKLPSCLEAKKAIINVKNTDDEYCFKWSLIAALSNLNKNANRCTTYKVNINDEVIQVNGITLNFTGLQFPLKPADISKFMEINKDINITLFGFDDGVIFGPIFYSPEVRRNYINMLILEEGCKAHYTWIKNLSK